MNTTNGIHTIVNLLLLLTIFDALHNFFRYILTGISDRQRMAFGTSFPGGTAFRGQAGLVTASLHEKLDILMQIRPNIN